MELDDLGSLSLCLTKWFFTLSPHIEQLKRNKESEPQLQATKSEFETFPRDVEFS